MILGMTAAAAADHTILTTTGAPAANLDALSFTPSNTFPTEPLYMLDSTTTVRGVFRFPGLAIPKNATIVRANVSFVVQWLNNYPSESYSTANDYMDLGFEQVADSAQIASASSGNTRATGVPDKVRWYKYDLGTEVGDRVYSPDLSASLQGVVNQSSWASGNAASCFYVDSATVVNGLAGRSYSTGAFGTRPRLDVIYVADGSGGSGLTTVTSVVAAQKDAISAWTPTSYWGETDPLFWFDKDGQLSSTALRFAGLTIPKNAQIADARIITYATADNGSHTPWLTSNTYVNIGAEQVDNATQLTSYANHISRSSGIGSTIRWDLPPINYLGYDVSPNLGSLVQTIVNRSGWSSGNAMQFFVANNLASVGGSFVSARRGSFYSTPTKTPMLIVKYF